jgi:protection-of-telomeres protein 1
MLTHTSLHVASKNLNELKEKLFILWGNLQELREAGKLDGAARGEISSKPFECCIEEYGVKQDGKWERMFKIHKTTIH